MTGGRVLLKLPAGKVIKPTASEIAGAEFKGRLEIRGVAIARKPSDAMPRIRFHRFSPESHLEVVRPPLDLSTRANVSLRLSFGTRTAALTTDPEDDQIIVGTEWLPLDEDTLSETRTILRTSGITRLGEIGLKEFLNLCRESSERVHVIEPRAHAENARSEATKPQLPTGFRGSLYDYQDTGFQWLTRIADESIGCVLGDEMGLGKTVQLIVLLLREQQEQRTPSLIVCPATLLENWRRELARFAPTLDVRIHAGPTRTGFPSALASSAITVTSYETAVRDLPMLSRIDWNVLVLDEAQSIKNPTALRTLSLKTLPKRVGVAVTGTPLENRLLDLWSIVDFAFPGFLGSQAEFEANYLDNIDNAARLEPLVRPLMLRRLVSEVAADLPPKIVIPQPVELEEEAISAYESLRLQIMQEHGAVATLVALTKLRMFCTHPFLIDERKGDPASASSKYARLIEVLEEVFASRHKCLIFTSFSAMIDIFVADLPARFGVPCAFIDGRVSVASRQPTIDAFVEREGPGVLVL